MDLEIKRFSAAIFPVNRWTSRVDFGEGVSFSVAICFGLALIHLLVTRYLRNSPEATPNVHFIGFNFIQNLLRM